MYANDSFHTLTPLGQFGLALLSLGLTAVVLFAAWRFMGQRATAVRLALGVGLFYGFVWLSPQIYYGYYLMLFEGLPWQNVLKPPPGPLSLLVLIAFQGSATLSAHALGLLGWSLIAMALAKPHLHRLRKRA